MAARMRSLAVLFLVTALPLAAWTPFYDCFPLTKWLLLVGISGVILAVSAPPPAAAFRWATIWTGWLGLSAATSTGPLWESLPAAALLALPPLAAAYAANWRRLTGALVVTAVLMAAHGLAQAAGWDAGAWLSPFHKGVASTIGNPDLLGGFLILPFAVSLAWALDRPAGWRTGSAMLLGAALIATEARAAWLGAGAAGFLLTFRRGKQALAIAAVALLLVAGWVAMNPATWARARSGGALTERVWTWRLAARIVADAPLAGTGPGTFRTQFLARQTAAHDRGAAFYHYTEYAHLEPLHLWVEVGAVGLGLFCWGLATALHGWWRGPLRARDPVLWRGVGAGAAGVLINAALSFPFHVIPTAAAFWLVLGAAALRPGDAGPRAARPAAVAGGARAPGAMLVAGRLAALALLLAVPFRLALENTALRDGQAAALGGRLDVAAARYVEGDRAMPADPRLAWYAATCARQQGDPAEALGHIEAAIRLEPGMYELHHERGMTLKALNRLPEAEAAYREAVRINPGFSSGWNNLGNLLGAAGRLKDAEAAQRRALALDPTAREARQNLAITLLREGRRREARDVLERGL